MWNLDLFDDFDIFEFDHFNVFDFDGDGCRENDKRDCDKHKCDMRKDDDGWMDAWKAW